MNVKAVLSGARGAITNRYAHLGAIFFVTALHHNRAMAQAANLGGIAEVMGGQAGQFTTALKLLAAFGGVAMVCYSIYGLGWGRKKDEREWPMGQTLAVGLFGALLTSIAVITGVLNASFLGNDESAAGLGDIGL